MSAGAPQLSPLHIALVGCGHMGGAMLRGWLGSGIVRTVHVINPVTPEGIDLADPRIVLHPSAADFARSKSANAAPDALIIAVRPNIVEEACAPLKSVARNEMLLISVAAGRSIESYQALFSAAQPIVRAMPNLAAALGKGMTGACASPAVSPAGKIVAQTLLETLGHVAWVNEGQMDAVTAVSGSGPGYLFHFTQALAQAGERAGLDPDTAMRLARQTMIGSAAFMETESEVAVETLWRNMMIGGTTEAALNILTDGRLQNILDEAVAAAVRRSKELSA